MSEKATPCSTYLKRNTCIIDCSYLKMLLCIYWVIPRKCHPDFWGFGDGFWWINSLIVVLTTRCHRSEANRYLRQPPGRSTGPFFSNCALWKDPIDNRSNDALYQQEWVWTLRYKWISYMRYFTLKCFKFKQYAKLYNFDLNFTFLIFFWLRIL